MGRPTNRQELPAASRSRWVLDIVLGVICGGVVGFIVAVNVVIYAGPDSGYQSSVGDVFQHSLLTGLVASAALLGGPIIGVAIAHRLRRQRTER